MSKAKQKERGVNPGRCRPNSLPNRYVPSINTIPQNASVIYKAKAHATGKITQRIADGRQGQTLYCLKCAGGKGITAAEVSTWALRLACYIFKLRHNYYLDIETIPEPNKSGKGNHGRYILHTRVQIVDIKMPDGASYGKI